MSLTSDDLAVSFCQSSNLITTGEVKDILFRFNGILMKDETWSLVVKQTLNTHPFHAVAGGDLAELVDVVQDGGVGLVCELAVVGRSTEVELPSRLRE